MQYTYLYHKLAANICLTGAYVCIIILLGDIYDVRRKIKNFS